MKKVLLVTGASSEVGIKLVKKIYRNYQTIYLHYGHMNDELEALVEQIKSEVKVVLLRADFMKHEEVLALIEEVKESGELPNNIVHLTSPKLYNKQFHKDKWDNFENAWQICMHSIVDILQAFIPDMAKQKYGRIVFALTSSTIDKPAKYQAGYISVKYALLGLMKTLSVEYSDRGITVNGISPDMMETKLLSEVPDLIKENNADKSPRGKNISVDEVIPAFECLLADESSALTGQNIGITGGL